jgi:hypothetical protein
MSILSLLNPFSSSDNGGQYNNELGGLAAAQEALLEAGGPERELNAELGEPRLVDRGHIVSDLYIVVPTITNAGAPEVADLDYSVEDVSDERAELNHLLNELFLDGFNDLDDVDGTVVPTRYEGGQYVVALEEYGSYDD